MLRALRLGLKTRALRLRHGSRIISPLLARLPPTAILIREDDGFVALCPEVDVASQGGTVEEAKRNLHETVKLFVECASPQKVAERLSSQSFVSSLEVKVS